MVQDTDEDATLEPYRDTIERRFDTWLDEQVQRRGKPFSEEQRQWLEYPPSDGFPHAHHAAKRRDWTQPYLHGGKQLHWDLWLYTQTPQVQGSHVSRSAEFAESRKYADAR